MYFKVLRKYDEHGNLLLRQHWDDLTRVIDEQKDLTYPFTYYNKYTGGIFVTDAEHILNTLYQGDKIAIVTIPDNSRFISVDDEISPEATCDGTLYPDYECDRYTGLFRAHKVNVVQVLDIWKIETFEHLKTFGLNFSNYGFSALDSAAEKGHLEIIKYLLEEGIDNEFFGVNMALKTSEEKGHKDISEYLREFKSKKLKLKETTALP